jgi:HSP20 family molecular chaperone IbpA
MPFRDPTASIWGEALEMLDRAERLQRQFFRLQRTARPGPSWLPPTDIFEQDEGLLIVVALPDVPPAQVEVLSEGGGLIVRGERPLPTACRQAVIRQLEIPYGRFERRIDLPAGEYVLARKTFNDGCLVLVLKKGGQR